MTFQELLVPASFVLYLAVIVYSIINKRLLKNPGEPSANIGERIFMAIILWPLFGAFFLVLGPVLGFAGKVMTLPIETLFK
jgi:hypothetical protein